MKSLATFKKIFRNGKEKHMIHFKLLIAKFFCKVIANGLYCLKVKGRDNLPLKGPALLVCNHVSFIDWLIIFSGSTRPVRFVMHHSYFKIPLMSGLFKASGVIPIAGAKEDPFILDCAFAHISRALSEGELVCIFPEGKLTSDGRMDRFKPGINRILKENRVPIIPMALNGMWGSFFSRKDGMALRKPFRRIRSSISLMIGRAIHLRDPGTALLYEHVSRLRSDV
jgi:1-acyl-sn-glycerol-3-phosphate acyltransferase